MDSNKPQHLTDFSHVDVTAEKFGDGGFGVVYMGPNRFDGGKWLALKTLRPELWALKPEYGDLFIRECLTWVGLWPHLNLLNVHAATKINGQIYIMMDYAQRGSLRDLLYDDLPLGDRLTWAQHIAAGLLAIHTPDPEFLRPSPLVHRDLKPENVLIHATGYAQITDFGLAACISNAIGQSPGVQEMVERAASSAQSKSGRRAPRAARTSRFTSRSPGHMSSTRVGQPGQGLGTTAYMPPEQWDTEGVVGPSADLYAFGLILSELLAGRHGLADLEAPLNEEGWYQLHLIAQPRPLRGGLAPDASRLPVSIEQLYQALLAKRPADRPTAAEALRVLQQAASQLGKEAYTPYEIISRTPEHRMIKWNNWATTYFRCDLFHEALACNDRALALDPQFFNVLAGRGSIISRLGSLAGLAGQEATANRLVEEALGWFNRALAVGTTRNEERAGLLGNKAMQLSALRHHAEAEAAYVAAMEISPTNGDLWLNRAINSLQWAQAKMDANRKTEARRILGLAESYIQRARSLGLNHSGIDTIVADIRQAYADLNS